MIPVGIDHQAVEDALHFVFDFVQQRLKFAGLNELGYVVVGVETLSGSTQPLTYLY